MVQATELGLWWPEVSRRVAAGLARRGVPAPDIADVVQETAARALASPPDVADADALARWAFTVATRISIDGHRRTSRVQLVPLDDDSPTGGDVGTIVEGRIRWQKTMRALSLLSGNDRAALAASLWPTAPTEADASRRQAVRDAVRLHRARTRLTAMVARLGIVLGALWGALRRRVRPLHLRLAAAVVVMLVLVLGVAQPAGISTASATPRTAPTRQGAQPQTPVPDAPQPQGQAQQAGGTAAGAGAQTADGQALGSSAKTPPPADSNDPTGTIDDGTGPGPGSPLDALNLQTSPSDVTGGPVNHQDTSAMTDCETGTVRGPGCFRAYIAGDAV
jgi:DNA-directed RNA polymerase specialized sigma24 family protein